MKGHIGELLIYKNIRHEFTMNAMIYPVKISMLTTIQTSTRKSATENSAIDK